MFCLKYIGNLKCMSVYILFCQLSNYFTILYFIQKYFHLPLTHWPQSLLMTGNMSLLLSSVDSLVMTLPHVFVMSLFCISPSQRLHRPIHLYYKDKECMSSELRICDPSMKANTSYIIGSMQCPISLIIQSFTDSKCS